MKVFASIDWQSVLVALIAATPAAIVAWRTGKRVDGRMEEMLALARDKAAAEATVDEKNAESDRRIEAKRVVAENAAAAATPPPPPKEI